MRLGIVIAAASLAALGACQRPQGTDWAAVSARAEAMRSECEAQLEAKALAGRLAAVRCANPPIRRLYADSSYPYMDLLDLMQASRAEIAERQDAGALTESQAARELAEVRARVVAEIQRRDGAAEAAWRASKPVVCNSVGGMTVCN